MMASELVAMLVIEKYGIFQHLQTTIYCENPSVIQIVHTNIIYECIKHIEVDCYFVQQNLLKNNLPFVSISFDNQTADIFTESHL